MTDTLGKRFKIDIRDIQPLARGLGACYASDKITVEGEKVAWMYREEAEFDHDSGWRFFSGTETQDYVDNPDNLEIFDCNTIANYDRDIIPLLSAPIGSAFERNAESGQFEAVEEE